MNRHLKIFIAILVIGSTAILGFRFTWPHIESIFQTETSDAAKFDHTLRLGVDNWVGYFPLCSDEMKRRLRGQGIQLNCVDDQADYQSRFRQLDRRELDLAVSTVDAYLLNGKAFDYPGVIVGIIDESKGGDAIVADSARVGNLNQLKQRGDTRIAFTPASPSEHLLKSIASHFDIPWLRERGGRWRVEAEGSSDALKRLQKGEAEVAVLWEPDVSRAIADSRFSVLISSRDTDKLIVDVLLAGRRLLQEHPELVESLLRSYFDTLSYYKQNPDQLHKEIEEATDLKAAQVDAMLAGVEWAGLTENAVNWFGITGSGLYGDEALIDAIGASLDVLMDSRDFDANPLPSQDPYRLTNRQAVEAIYGSRNLSAQQPAGGQDNGLSRAFKPLGDDAWLKLKEIGNLRVEAISFRRGSGNLDLEGKHSLDKVAERLKRYPNFRILVKGHSGVRGDPQANLALSADRAEAVVRYLLVTYPLDANRIHALGFGGSQPLPRQPGESDRAYGYRLPRVEIALVSEEF